MHVEVSTLPATTDAGERGLSIEPSGITMSSGRRQPALSGMSSSTNVRNTYNTAAVHTAVGALKLLASWGDEPVKSITAERSVVFTRTVTVIRAPLSSGSVKVPSRNFEIT